MNIIFSHRMISVISVASMSTATPSLGSAPAQGYCTAQEAQEINARGLSNLYYSNPSMACADFLAAINAGHCPAAAVGTAGAANPETINYIQQQFQDYGIYDPYDWELNYAASQPDFFDIDLAIAILLLEREDIFDVFPQELFVLVKDRRHFRDHLRDIRNRIDRHGNRPDAHGNRPIHLDPMKPKGKGPIDPKTMNNNINRIRSASPNLGQGAQTGAPVTPGRGLQPTMPLVHPNVGGAHNVFPTPQRLVQPSPHIVRPVIPSPHPIMPSPHPVMPHIVIPHGGGGMGGGHFGGGGGHFGGGGGGGHFGGGGGGGHFGGGGGHGGGRR